MGKNIFTQPNASQAKGVVQQVEGKQWGQAEQDNDL